MPRFRFDVPATGRSWLPLLHAAAVSWALSRTLRGEFVLRLEAASGDGADPPVLADLRSLNIDWDEGPEIGGAHAPYLQAARGARYAAVLDQLRVAGHTRKGDEGEYLHSAETSSTPFNELLRGEIAPPPTLPVSLLLQDANGAPTRLLRTAVDDHDMDISYAVHPADDLAWLGALDALFRVLAWTPPQWIVMPPLLDPQGEPLAQQSAYAVPELLAAGFLPAAVCNFLLLLGWAPTAEEEILDRWTMRRRVQLSRFVPDPLRIDQALLLRLNRHYLAQLDDGALAEQVYPLLDDAFGEVSAGDRWLTALVQLLRPNLARLTDFVPLAAWAFATDIEYTDAARAALLQEDAALVLVRFIAAIARDAVLLDRETAAHILAQLAAQLHHSQPHPAISAALLGEGEGPPLSAVCALLGRERTLQRLAAAVRWRGAQRPPAAA